MKINFYANLRDIVGQKTVLVVNLPPGATVQQLLEAAIEEYPALRPELLDENGKFHQQIKMYLNGREVPNTKNPAETPLQVDDTLDILPLTETA